MIFISILSLVSNFELNISIKDNNAFLNSFLAINKHNKIDISFWIFSSLYSAFFIFFFSSISLFISYLFQLYFRFRYFLLIFREILI